MTDTPDVDAAAFEEHGLPGSLVVHVDFARRIKREFLALGETIRAGTTENLQLQTRLAQLQADKDELTKMFDKQKAHSLALQTLLAAICEGKPPTAQPAAPEHSKLAAEHHKRLLAAEAKRAAEIREVDANMADERRIWSEKFTAMETRVEKVESERRLATELTVLQEHLAAIEEHIRCILPAEVKDE